MRRPVTPILVLLGLVAVAFAQDNSRTYLDVTGLADGDYHLKIVGGVVSVVPIRVLSLTGKNPNPDPLPNRISQKSEQLAREIADPATAQSLAVALSVVIVRAEAGAYLRGAEVGDANRTAITSILNTEELQNRWAIWRSSMTAEVIRLSQESPGGLNVGQYTDVIKQMRSGLLASVGGDATALDFQRIFAIVRMVLEAIEDQKLQLAEIIAIALEVVKLFGVSGVAVSQ